MKNFVAIFAVLMTAMVLILGCGSADIREGIVLANRFLIETANSMVNMLTEGQEVPANNIKDIKNAVIDTKDATYFEIHIKKDDGSFELVAAGLIKDGKLTVVKVYKVVVEQVVYLYLFKEGVNVWSQRVTLKVTTVIPTTPAPAANPPANPTPAANPPSNTNNNQVNNPAPPTNPTPAVPVANPVVTIVQVVGATGRELTANIANLPVGGTLTYQWYEEDAGAWKVITGATNANYTATPGVAPLRFKVKATINGTDYEAEAVVNP